VHAGLSRRFVFPGWIRIGNPWVNSRCSLRIQVPHLEVAYGNLGVFLTLLATPKVPTIDERQGARAAIAQRRNQFLRILGLATTRDELPDQARDTELLVLIVQAFPAEGKQRACCNRARLECGPDLRC